MSKATGTVKHLRQQLAKAEQTATKRAKEREKTAKEYLRNRQAATTAFREELYDGSFGKDANYLGVTAIEGGVELDAVEWTVVQTCVTLTRDEMESLRNKLTELLG